MGVIDMRKGDIDKITSLIKSWIYLDCFLKPEEEILYRSIREGGLGLNNIEMKAAATLTNSFIEAAVNEKFVRNHFMESLFNYYVDGIGVKRVVRPPWYSDEFFGRIREAREEGLEVVNMTVKQWYWRFLNKVTHIKNPVTLTEELKQSRVEYIFPHINHKLCFRNIRYSGFPSKIMSVLFKLKYDLYLTEERRYYCKLSNSSRCKYCPRTDHIGHFLICAASPMKRISERILQMFQSNIHNITLERIMNMEMEADQDVTFALGWMLAAVTDHHFNINNLSSRDSEKTLIARLKTDFSMFNQMSIKDKKYVKVSQFIAKVIDIYKV